MLQFNDAFTSWEWEWGGMWMGWEWEWAGMGMWFQCGKNKWEWELGMRINLPKYT